VHIPPVPHRETRTEPNPATEVYYDSSALHGWKTGLRETTPRRSGWAGYLLLSLAISTIRRCAVVILSGNVRVPTS
jgi:hypothetical protein